MNSERNNHDDPQAADLGSAESAVVEIKKRLAVALKQREDASLDERESAAARVDQLQSDLSEAVRNVQELKRAESLQREIDHKQKRERKRAVTRQRKHRQPSTPVGQADHDRVDWEAQEAYEQHLEAAEREREEEAEKTRTAFDQAVAAEKRDKAAAHERKRRRLEAEEEARAEAEALQRSEERAARVRERQAASLRRKEEAKMEARRRREQRGQAASLGHAPIGLVARVRRAMTAAWHWIRKRK